jgi:hypothetical protein
MDFIIGLPNDNSYNQLLVIINKFSKCISLIPDKLIYTTKE